MRSEIGNKYDRHQAIIAHLRDYAVTSGAVDYLENNGTIPQYYLDYEQRYLSNNLPSYNVNLNNERSLVGILYKKLFCFDAFNVTLPLLGTPFFIFNNNEASSFEGLFIGGYHTGFDRAFYRRRLFGITTWQITCTNLPPAVDNAVSSWWSIGL